MTGLEPQENIHVFVGVDVGKGAHHAAALDPTGTRRLDRDVRSAFAALRDPMSRAYNARKISQGKRHNQSLIALALARAAAMSCSPCSGTGLSTAVDGCQEPPVSGDGAQFSALIVLT